MKRYEREIVSEQKCNVKTDTVEPKDDDLWSLVTDTGFNVAGPGWILVQADDGVLWGKVENGQPVFPKGVDGTVCPTTKTAWSVRVFNSKAELLLWKDDATWRWRILTDADVSEPNVKWTEWIEEKMMLYGTGAKCLDGDFSTMSEGAEGLVHTVPLALPTKAFNHADKDGKPVPYHPLRLVVRHYLEEDKNTGMVKIVASRLVTLECAKEG